MDSKYFDGSQLHKLRQASISTILTWPGRVQTIAFWSLIASSLPDVRASGYEIWWVTDQGGLLRHNSDNISFDRIWIDTNAVDSLSALKIRWYKPQSTQCVVPVPGETLPNFDFRVLYRSHSNLTRLKRPRDPYDSPYLQGFVGGMTPVRSQSGKTDYVEGNDHWITGEV